MLLTSVALLKTKAEFVQPMLLRRAERLPEGPNWLYELKLDGLAGASDQERQS